MTISDASLSGIPVCRGHPTPQDVAAVGRVSERWRFKAVDPGARPRAKALNLDPFKDPSTVRLSKEDILASQEDPFFINNYQLPGGP